VNGVIFDAEKRSHPTFLPANELLPVRGQFPPNFNDRRISAQVRATFDYKTSSDLGSWKRWRAAGQTSGTY
jgi:hypothetical protein